MTLYTQRPGVYDIRQYTGDNASEIEAFLGDRIQPSIDDDIAFWSLGNFEVLHPGDSVAKTPSGNYFKISQDDIAAGYEPLHSSLH